MTGVQQAVSAQTRKRVAPLTIVLAAITLFFCAVLIFVYIATKRANPVMLDQQGRPPSQDSQRASQ